MKAVILAAGQGTRLRSVHGEHPKCLIDVDDFTILDHQFEAIARAGIHDVAIVVGYEKEQIVRHVKANWAESGLRVQLIENPAFAMTNNIFSLWLAIEWLRGDSFVVLNADVVFDPEILVSAVHPFSPISMILDPLWRDETMKVIIEDDRVIRMSKKISREEFSGTYIGITVFSKGIQGRFFDKLDSFVMSGEVNGFFNVAVQELADEGVAVGYTTTGGLAWAEIDDPLDLMFAQQAVFPNIARAA
ncbi:phosphocholine cytidylyltransferase family protein [Occallatibacter riparius]|uniref:Phosphocholine cytidylyltransferase family protein n=1 Tax=Occallatibacter riparius TaxID=1002689 RepID=A0A9J7BRJ0_9BACT|nr:phosphocholine cytidylyltransferase family protein [Occallatibacter riparius]UWZ85191.1 phosphocholine cytidylyltransferase family protein [Occallatibacter riparius]